MASRDHVTQQRLSEQAVLAILPDQPYPEDRFVILDSLEAARAWLPGHLAKHGGDAYVVPLALVFRGGELKPPELFPIDD